MRKKKKIEMDYTIITYLMFGLGKSFLWNLLHLLTIYIVIAVSSKNIVWNKNESISFHCSRFLLIHCILNLESASFWKQPQPPFISLQFDVVLVTNTLELSNEVLLSETKLSHLIMKATRIF